jgi:hypothetical protein
MTDLPALKLKALVNFPATVLDGIGTDVTKINGNYQIDLAYNDFAPPVGGVSDPTNQTVLLWNKASGAYSLTPISLFGGGGGVPEAPIDGTLYGRKNGNWTAVPTGGGTPSDSLPIMDGAAAAGVLVTYSRGDHAHPTDTSRQPLDADLTAVAALSSTGIARRTATTPTWAVGGAVTNAELATMPAFTFKGNNTTGTATPTDVDIALLTTKASPAGGDYLLVSDQAASGAWKKVAISSMPGASGGIADAPNDGLQYGRQSLGWTQITGGGATPSSTTPLMDGIGAAGVSTLYSRGDHVHPTDTNRQPLDAELTAIAGLVSAADQLPYFTGSGTASLTTLTTYGRSLIAAIDATTARSTLGLTAAATATPAALTKTDDTNVTLALGGTPATALLQATSITVGWSGTLSTARGGLGGNNSASNGVPLFAAGVVTMTGTTGTGNLVRADTAVLTGNPTAPTPAVDDNDTSIATTAYVIGQASAAGDGTPAMNGAAARGTAIHWARADHIHPSDTSRAPLASPALTGVPTAPTAAVNTNTTQIATTAFVFAQPAQSVIDGCITYAKMATAALAGAADYLANTASKILTANTVWAAAVPATLTDAATVTPDFSAGIDFVWTIAAVGRTLTNPSNPKAGQKGVIYVVQDGTGSRTITTWGSQYKFSGGTKPTLSTAASAVDVISYACKSTTEIECFFSGAMS